MSGISTARLVLRHPLAADALALMEIHQDPEVSRNTVHTGPTGGVTVAWRNIAMMLGHWQLRGYGQWAVIERATGEVIGRVGFYNPEGWPGIELGWIIRRTRWGNGFATEAARAALKWGAGHLDAAQVISLITPDNLRSLRVATKLDGRFDRVIEMGDTQFHLYVFDLGLA
jgi:RimJ/RimL family protein N-acetyltransferase